MDYGERVVAKMVHRRQIAADKGFRMQFRPFTLISALGLLVGLTACAKVNDLAWRGFSTKVDAVMIVDGQLLTGTVLLVPDRTGRVTMGALKGPITSCMGALRFTSTSGGSIDLRCDDGSQTELTFTLLSETRGYGYGKSASGAQVSMAFGLDATDAKAYLLVPSNKKLVLRPKDSALELQ